MKSECRVGHKYRADGEWEVFNAKYDVEGRGYWLVDTKPWIAYHPDQNISTFATHAEAIKHINKVESGDIW